jgi:hypothetical protein
MAVEPVVLDLDAAIARLEREAKVLLDRAAVLKEIRAEELARQGASSDGKSATPASHRIGDFSGYRENPAHAPRGKVSGTEGAAAYLREIGRPESLAEIHRGALERGAAISYGALHAMMSEDAKKGKTFTRGPERGQFGLVEWTSK